MPSPKDYYDFVLYIFSSELQTRLWPLRTFFILITFAFLSFIIVSIFRTRWFKFILGYAWVEFFTLQPFGLEKATRQWGQIRDRFNKPADIAEYRRAVVKAHKILDDFIDDIVIFYQTTSCAERLARLGPETIKNIEQLRQTEEIAKKLALDPNYHLSQDEYLSQLEVFHQAFIDLGIARD